jgi:hypothetical protein
LEPRFCDWSASLERQLSGQVANTLQDILEEMMEPWLRTHSYIQ